MFQQMKYFIAVVDRHNFTRAAEENNISQSAIFQQIKELENMLDVKSVSYTHLTLPTIAAECRSRWSPYH